MVTRIRTIDFLPEIFKTKTNEQFLSATLDQIVKQPNTEKIQGYIGSKFGYGVKADDKYIIEKEKYRNDYQLDPAVVFRKKNTAEVVDLITYRGILNALSTEGALVEDNNRLFSSQFYSWDSFTDLDKLINYGQYYWLPNGPETVVVTNSNVYFNTVYTITKSTNAYDFLADTVPLTTSNPTISLMRGGEYTFVVNQDNPFFIQGVPGVTGMDPVRTNINTREILGVTNNGASTGTITFKVPLSTEQDNFNYPGNTEIDLATRLSFDKIHGRPLRELQDIDGINSLEGRTLIFYGAKPDERGYLGDLFASTPFGVDNPNTAQTDVFEDGLYTNVADFIYRISYQGTGNDVVIQLEEYEAIPNNQKLTVLYGSEFATRNFVKPSYGQMFMIPYLSAKLDTLYYQDGSNSGVFGKIKILEQTSDNAIYVETDIIGKKSYTSPNDIKFTNGLKVTFTGFIFPETYKQGTYYVEGVGESINLIPVDELVVPEPFTESFSSPFEVKAFDAEAFSTALSVPSTKDFITINRNSRDRNAWSRSNRWFHHDVLTTTIQHTPNSPIAQAALNGTTARANRPIIEFYPSIRLFNHGTEYKAPVDYIDFTTTDALNELPGKNQFMLDGQLVDISDGSRIIFAADNNPEVRSKIYIISNSIVKDDPATAKLDSTITLSLASDSDIGVDQQIIIVNGNNAGKSYYYTGVQWNESQQKRLINQPPKFDVFDQSGVSFGDQSSYPGSDFEGCTLFEYATGTGADDPVLGIPLAYSSVDNIGDIAFTTTLNTDTFSYLTNGISTTGTVGHGYVYKYDTRTDYARQIGWQTAIGPSFQYQIFNFDLTKEPGFTFVCDVVPKDQTTTPWPTVVVYLDNARLKSTDYTVTSSTDSSTFQVLRNATSTSLQIMIYSDQVSKTGYYQIPSNFDSNPFNGQITTIHMGDIRGHFKSICNNCLSIEGDPFGANNYRDLGNLVPYGTRIIQNSGSMGMPAMYLRLPEFNLFNALSYNSTEYIKFKALLINTVETGDYNSTQQVDEILDDVMSKIAAIRTTSNPFYWSDMLPSKSPSSNRTYPINNSINEVNYPLSRTYTFAVANYYSVLVYLTRTVDGEKTKIQLVRDEDYIVSESEPQVTIKYKLIPGDVINVKEYDQTFGNFVPSTPTKLGLYPKTEPEVETYPSPAYLTPTTFIVGHDSSYTKIYGEFVNGKLTDLRDKVLFEYELRVFNNLKATAKIPLKREDIFPGFFRKTEFSYDEVQKIYSTQFLNWVGKNRIDYKSQFFDTYNQFTWNYNQSRNKIDNSEIKQGGWRGLYIWLYDTHSPDTTPWEMLGYTEMPTWWINRYGAAPYTSDNTFLWDDLEKGYDYNDGNPYINSKFARPGLSEILPVNSLGKLLSPIETTIGFTEATSYNRSWKVGDVGPAEFSYLKSSSWPFDLMRIFALTKPSVFFTQGTDLDYYRYNEEFNQFLVYDRFRSAPTDMVVYGGGLGKTRAEIENYANHSINVWVVDYLQQFGYSGSQAIVDTIQNLDVNLTYRIGGFTDKDMMNFYVEKGSPNSKNSSLLIPDESYTIRLHENQPFDRIYYSSVIVQKTESGFTITGNSQDRAYFQTFAPKVNGNTESVTVNNATIKLYKDSTDNVQLVPYGTEFQSYQGICQFLVDYGRYLESCGMIFDTVENSVQVTWRQMVNELMYWMTTGWENNSIISINPAAKHLAVNRPFSIVQSLTLQGQNYVLDQDLNPIQTKDLAIYRNGTEFRITAVNEKQTIAYFTANLSNIEHIAIFDNTTIFNDTIFNVTTGLRQQRFYVRGMKTSDWNGSFDTQGFILNQENINEWKENQKYPKGMIVHYKNNYWVANSMIQPDIDFSKQDWVKTEYELISKGMLPNASTRAFESTLYYDGARSNLGSDADMLGFSLVGYRPRDYLAQANLSDISQFNVYKDIIKSKGTKNSINVLNNAELPQGKVNYSVYDNWAIKSSEYGGISNQNFIELTINKNTLSSNPHIIGITTGEETEGVHQYVALNTLTNYNKSLLTPSVFSKLSDFSKETEIFRSAGYVNFDDITYSAFNFAGLNSTSVNDLYKNDYVWIANHNNDWDVFSPTSITNNNNPVHLTSVNNNLNGTATFIFDNHHNLTEDSLIAIVHFNDTIDGFYDIVSVTSLTSVVVTLSLDSSVTTISGFALAIRLQSHRLLTPSDISYLPLLDNEFVRNKAWVDYGVDGNWSVYEKTNNYAPSIVDTYGTTSTFGNSVAYSPILGYFFADKGEKKVHRMAYEEMLDIYSTQEILQPLFGRTTPATYGACVVVQGDMLVISQPDNFGTNSFIWIYKLVNTQKVKRAVYQQYIWVSGGGIGQHMTMSGDTNYLYASADSYSGATVFQKNVLPFIDTTGILLKETAPLGSTTLVVTGNKVVDLPSGEEITFSTIDSSITSMIVTAKYSSGTNTTTFYLYDPLTVEIPAGAQILTSSINYSFVGVFTAGNDPTDGFSLSMSTTYNGDMVFVGAPGYDFSQLQRDTGMGYVFERLSETFEVQADSPAMTNTIVVVPWLTSSGTVVSINGVRYDTVLAGTRPAPVWVYPDVFIAGATVILIGPDVFAGDRITVDSVNMVEKQVISAYDNSSQVSNNAMFSQGLDCNISGADLVVGAPYFIDENGVEGHVYRFINEGKKYGVITGILPVTLAEPADILINHFRVSVPAGNAKAVADAINLVALDNIVAEATDDTDDGKLIVRLRNPDLGPINNKLTLTVFDGNVLYYLGISEYTKTQVISSPHVEKGSQFGYSVKFNEYNSFVVSAPTGTRFLGTQFDFTDDANNHNDTAFDNNFTQFVDFTDRAGAVYMYDYLPGYNESLFNSGNYVYAQALDDTVSDLGQKPMYGKSLFYRHNKVIVGTPDFKPAEVGGRVVVFNNALNLQNWNISRTSNDVIDISKIQKAQVFDNVSNTMVAPLDYIDPIQGKLLGVVRHNIDYVSYTDPAGYNTNGYGNIAWGKSQVGHLWFDPTDTRFVNYHQSSISYNSKYWGKVFPGSTVTVYTWVESDVTPAFYAGTGTPYDIEHYTTSSEIDSTGSIVTKYYYWVRGTNKVFTNSGKTLSDAIIETYIKDPQSTGIPYIAFYSASSFGLYNANDMITENTNLYVGYSNTGVDNPSHAAYQMIRDGSPDDFLPGFPTALNNYSDPTGLYLKLIDSFAGLDTMGSMVPNPNIPLLMRIGVSNKPNQSMFVDRLSALKNYLVYVNSILVQYPVYEFKEASWLHTSGATYDTTQYWNYVNWWATGYSDSTKTLLDVDRYYELQTIEAFEGMLVGVNTNSSGRRETYVYNNGAWVRVGLENGTIAFSSSLWNYSTSGFGLGTSFFDTDAYDNYPSMETRYIIRAINEQLFVGELFKYRNEGLILLFEFIQSENIAAHNYLTWLNKTSFIDVGNTVRNLETYPKFQKDDDEMLYGYLQESKPYHVVIKDFFMRYSGLETYSSGVTDFDLPALYNTSLYKFVSPQLVFNPPNATEFAVGDPIWSTQEYVNWYNNIGLQMKGTPNAEVALVAKFITDIDTEIYVDNAYGLPVTGVIRIDDELIGYSHVDRVKGILQGLSRGAEGTDIVEHYPSVKIYMDLPGVVVVDTGRGYIDPPSVKAVVDTTRFPAPTREAVLTPVMSGDKLIGVTVNDPGEGYVTIPEIHISPSLSVGFNDYNIDFNQNTIVINTNKFVTGDLVRFVHLAHSSEVEEQVTGLVDNTFYYVKVLAEIDENTRLISLHSSYAHTIQGDHPIELYTKQELVVTRNVPLADVMTYALEIAAKASPVTKNTRARQIKSILRYDRTSYGSNIEKWEPGMFWPSPFNSLGNDASSTTRMYDDQASVTSASWQGAMLDIVNVNNDQGTVVATVDYSHSNGLEPGQIKGLRMYFYKTFPAYQYDDTANNGAKFKIYRPRFDPTGITNAYYIVMENSGTIYSDNSEIRVRGGLLGGKDGLNDFVLKVRFVTIQNGISIYDIEGIAVGEFKMYYANPVASDQIKVYNDPSFRVPVLYEGFEYGAGDYIFLPEPFSTSAGYKYVVQATVSYQGKVYRCIRSNSDLIFDYAKWAEVDPSDRSLNAIDRVLGYYNPTSDMPGNILQVVQGITYPYNVYKGNVFANDEMLPLDMVLQDMPFYPRDINITSIVYDGINYIATADAADHSVVLVSPDGKTWNTYKVSNKVLGLTGVITTNTPSYIVTANISSAPVLISFDIQNWETLGAYTPYDVIIFGESGFDSTGVQAPRYPMSAIATLYGDYYAVGDKGYVIKSSNGLIWNDVYMIGSKLPNVLKSITVVECFNYAGLVAVGYGMKVISGADSAAPVIEQVGRVLLSVDGSEWNLVDPIFTNEQLHTVTSSEAVIIAAGSNATIYRSNNGVSWTESNVNGVTSSTIRGSIYANGVFVLVGDTGAVLTSDDGIEFYTQTSGTNKNLKSITFDGEYFIAAGDYGVIIRSNDDGVTWQDVSFITSKLPNYTIKGDDFVSGYGPEELVAGIVNDTLSMKVITKPGAFWDTNTLIDTQNDIVYGYTGFGMESKRVTPDFNNKFSFDGILDNPVQIAVFVEDKITGLSTRIYQDITPTSQNPYTYSVNWVSKTITMNMAVATTESVFVEVYDFGNGREVIRTNSISTPLGVNADTGTSQFTLSNYKYVQNFSLFSTSDVNFDPVVFCNGVKLSSNDFEVAFIPEGTRVTFDNLYDPAVDYITFVILSSTLVPEYNNIKFGYSLPETEVFVYADSNTFTLVNYIGGSTVDDAIVELNGNRLSSTQYSFDTNLSTITIIDTLAEGDIVSVTTYHDTKRQQLVTTELDTFETSSFAFVDNTSSIVVSGERYPTITITTKDNHSFVDGDLIRIDGLKGMLELNNTTHYVKVKTAKSFELYEQVTLQGQDLVFFPPTSGSGLGKFIPSGYAWKDEDTVQITSDFTYTTGSRTWVTVNGERVNPENLRYNEDNKLSIMAPISVGDKVMITSMVSDATPGQLIYHISVDKKGNGEIHRVQDNVWLTQPLYVYEDSIHVNNARKLVNNVVENVSAVTTDSGVVAQLSYRIEDLSGLIVQNINTLTTLGKDQYVVKNVNSRPTVIFNSGVSEGDNLVITLQIGHIVEINGEQIHFRTVDYVSNTVSGLTRGIKGTGIRKIHNTESYVHGFNDVTKLDAIFYNNIMSSTDITPMGDPMQISSTPAAKFLRTGSY
jgi:hypothetical protein